ncbi:unnamed protein product [Calicophoron daubneyi]|uniref:Nardilysin n=1 Tax=Calicophoron daubneyi TaxID=300641 RepID=A0AAV2TGC1_CALDB
MGLMQREGSFCLEKSLVDNRIYRYFQLDNGLKVIAISTLKPGEEAPVESPSDEDEAESEEELDEEEGVDEKEECESLENKSAAALCVRTGSFSDPPEAQGLSHFLEHMVFMGSAKYPSENDFGAYLSKRGGQSNAWTSNEFTLFHFDVKRKHFQRSLDRFANFFISPLLQRDSTDRELAAVHSEFELANARDSSRLQHFIGSLAAPDSPFRIFGYGNFRSLKEIPEENHTDIYSLLQKYREQMYSSHRMTLALYSKDTLDNLEKMAREIFSGVPNSGVPPMNFSKLPNPFDVPTFNRFYKVCPLGDREKLRIVWSLPPLQNAYESCPIGILSALVGHEGEGSIIALLRKKTLAVSLSTGMCPTSDYENSSLCTMFIVNISLTDLGRDNVYEVCQIVFDYMKLMLDSARAHQYDQTSTDMVDSVGNVGEQISHTFASYIPEFMSNSEAGFLYREPDDPEETVVHVANMMQLVPPEEVFSAYNLLKKPNMKLYIQLLEQLTPKRAAIVLFSSHFGCNFSKTEGVEVDKWFKVRYLAEDIPAKVMKEWEDSKPSPSLHLPFKNKFITTNFDLLPSTGDMKAPRDLNLNFDAESRRRFGQLWFQQSTRFKSPKALYVVHLWSPEVSKSRQNMALHVLLTYSLNQTLSTIVYEATEANFMYNLEHAESGFKLFVTGFNQKLFRFYKTMLDHIVGDSLQDSNSHFEAHREVIRQLYFNETLKPKLLNSHLQFFILRKASWLLEDLYNAIRKVSFADLVAYKQRFFSQLRITIYAHGNLTEKDAIEVFDYTVKRTGCVPLAGRKFSDVAVLSPGAYEVRVMNCNPSDVNMCISQVHLLGKSDLKQDTYNRLLAYILSDPAFDYLRTKETLGYSVGLHGWRSSPGGNLHSGITLIACSQANQYSASFVAGRLSAFWYRICPRIVASMSPEGFQTAVDSLITLQQLEDPNMFAEADRNWEELFNGEAMFNRREETVKILRTVTKEGLLEFFEKEYLDGSRSRSLFIQVDAAEHPDPDAVSSFKASNLITEHVHIDDKIKLDEKKSYEEVDIPGALSACGFDDVAATKFMAKVDSPLLVKDPRPREDSVVYVDNVRLFRSKLTYEPGRVI